MIKHFHLSSATIIAEFKKTLSSAFLVDFLPLFFTLHKLHGKPF